MLFRVDYPTDALMAERDENTCRKDFTPTEAAAMRAAVAAALAPVVEQERREAISKTRSGDGAKLAPSPKTREVAARGTGYGHATLDKVDKTKALAEDESQPEPVRVKSVAICQDPRRSPPRAAGYTA